MITGWGAHHVDIAHWGMDTEYTGPIEIEGQAEFPKSGLWNVHGPYHIEAKYANGVTMIIDNHFTNGIRFEGADGWIFVSRGSAKVTASDPATAYGKALEASDPRILNSKIGPNEYQPTIAPIITATGSRASRRASPQPLTPSRRIVPPAPASSVGSP